MKPASRTRKHRLLAAAVIGAVAVTLLPPTPGAEAVPAPSIRASLASDTGPNGTFRTSTGHVASANDPVAFQLAVRNGNIPLQVLGIELQLGNTVLDLATVPATTSDCGILAQSSLTAKENADCAVAFERLIKTYGGQPRTHLDVTAIVTARDEAGTLVSTQASHRIVNDGAGDVGVEILVEHDADGDGIFAASETASVGGGSVPFRVTIRNDAHGRVVITELVHLVRGTETDLLIDACPHLAGLALRGHHGDDDGGGCGGHDDDGGCGGGEDDDHDDDHGAHDDDHGAGGHGGGHGRSRPTEVSCEFLMDAYAPSSGRLVGHTRATVSKEHGEDAPSAVGRARTVVIAPSE